MDNEQYTTKDFAKLFLLMVIPVYGLFFTVLLAFSKDISPELKSLARGALIARIIFVLGVIAVIGGFFYTILPKINEFIRNSGLTMLFR